MSRAVSGSPISEESHSATPQAKTPVGVLVVSVVTLLSSVGLGYLTLLMFALQGVGLFGNPNPTLEPFYSVRLLIAALLTLSSFVLPLIVFSGLRSKMLWQALVVTWVGVLVFVSVFFVPMWIGFFGSQQSLIIRVEVALAFALPFIYGLSCLSYFFTNAPKYYFKNTSG